MPAFHTDLIDDEIERLRGVIYMIQVQALNLTNTPVGQIVYQSAKVALQTDARISQASVGDGK